MINVVMAISQVLILQSSCADDEVNWRIALVILGLATPADMPFIFFNSR